MGSYKGSRGEELGDSVKETHGWKTGKLSVLARTVGQSRYSRYFCGYSRVGYILIYISDSIVGLWDLET